MPPAPLGMYFHVELNFCYVRLSSYGLVGVFTIGSCLILTPVKGRAVLPIQIKVQVQYFQYQNMKPICYLTLVLPALLARGYVESHGNDGHKGMDKSRNARQSDLTPLKEMFSKKDMDITTGSKIWETRAVDLSVSV